MRSMFALKKIYEPFYKFLCHNVQLPPCPEDILIREIRSLVATYRNKPLDPAAHAHIHAILADLCLMMDKSDDDAPPSRWTSQLAALAFLPVQMPNGEINLMAASEGCYVPDIAGELADVFRDRLPLVTLPPEKSGGTILRIHRLFCSNWVPRVKFLDVLVQRTTAAGAVDGRSPNTALTALYRTKLLYVRRYVRSSGNIMWATHSQFGIASGTPRLSSKGEACGPCARSYPRCGIFASMS